MDKEIPVKEFIREMMDVQAKAYRTVVEMLVNDVKSELRLLKNEVSDIKSSLQFSQRDIEEINEKLSGVDQKIATQSAMVSGVLGDLDAVVEKADDLENRSRRNNIKVFGIPEEPFEDYAASEAKLKSAIANKLAIKDEIIIERAHRVGPKDGGSKTTRYGHKRKNSNEPRPIIAKLLNWKQKDSIIKAARKVRPQGISFRDDFSERVLAKRAALIPEMLAARQEGKHAFLVRDRLIVRKQSKPPESNEPGTANEEQSEHESNASNESENEVFIRNISEST